MEKRSSEEEAESAVGAQRVTPINHRQISMARVFGPVMRRSDDGTSSLVALSFLASERVFPNYGVMSVAKAALECTIRNLAVDLVSR